MMKNDTYIHWLCLCLLLLTCEDTFAQTRRLNLDSCQHYARNNYPLIKQYELIDKATEYTISNANKAYLPHVSLTGIGAYIFGGFPSLGPTSGESENAKLIGIAQVNQVIWDGGATGTQKEIARAQANTEKANTDVMLYALKERINQLYFGALLIDEQTKQLTLQVEMLDRNLKRIQLLNKSGMALSTDMSELKAEMLKLRQRQTELAYTRKSFVYMLSLFIAQPLDEHVEFEMPVSATLQPTDNKRPELELYKQQRSLLEAQSGMNNVKLMPKVGILGAGVLFVPGLNLGMQEKSSIALAGLSVSWDIDGLYTHKSTKELNRIGLQKINLQQETFLFSNAIQKEQSNSEIQKYRELETIDNEIIEMRKTIRESYQLQYEAGNCPLNDVITATDKESDALTQKALHHVQYLMSVYVLKTTTGN